MNVLDIAIGIVVLSSLVSTVRMLTGPTDADRAIAGDLLLFAVVGLIALFSVRSGATFTFDIVLIGALVGALGTLSLARALTRGVR